MPCASGGSSPACPPRTLEANVGEDTAGYAAWRDDGRLELVFDGPQPVTLLAVLITVELADMAGGQG